jgi:hypothetical protein
LLRYKRLSRRKPKAHPSNTCKHNAPEKKWHKPGGASGKHNMLRRSYERLRIRHNASRKQQDQNSKSEKIKATQKIILH